MNDFEVVLDGMRGVMRTRTLGLPRHASFSSLDSYANCPAQWAFSRLWRPRPEWADPLTVGSLAHATLELAVRQSDVKPAWLALVGKAILMERERSVLPANRWKGEPIPSHVRLPNGREASDGDWARLVASRLNEFSLLDVFDGESLSPAAVEERLDADIWGVPMTGSVDYRDMSGRIVDWKTGRLPAEGSAKAISHANQLRVYKALLDAHGTRVADARDVYVEHHTCRMADLSDDAMAVTGNVMRERWDGMRRSVDAGEYALTPSYLCSWCPLARVCPSAWTARGDKARKAMMRGIGPDDPRVRVTGTRPDGDPLAGLFGDACGGKILETKGTVMDLWDMLDTSAMVRSDPWSTTEGQEAAARWGFDDTLPLGGGQSDKPKTGPTRRLMVQGKPYDPSLLTGGAVNSAGYGFTRLTIMAGEAYQLDARQAQPILLALLQAGWSASRQAWGENVPDVPGLEEGRPNVEKLLAWLDTPLARNADETIGRLLPLMDGDPLERVGKAGRAAAETMGMVRTLIA